MGFLATPLRPSSRDTSIELQQTLKYSRNVHIRESLVYDRDRQITPK
jgi:hypothetical protein